MSSSEITPSLRGTLISPSVRHCLMSSTKIRARPRILGSSSWSPSLSAPTAAMWVPSEIQPSSTIGSLDVVVAVTPARDPIVLRLLAVHEVVEGFSRAAPDAHVLPPEDLVAGRE